MSGYQSVERELRLRFQQDYPEKTLNEFFSELSRNYERYKTKQEFEDRTEEELIYVAENCTWRCFWFTRKHEFPFPGIRPKSMDSLSSTKKSRKAFRAPLQTKKRDLTTTDSEAPLLFSKTNGYSSQQPSSLSTSRNHLTSKQEPPYYKTEPTTWPETQPPSAGRKPKEPGLPLKNGNIQYAVYPPVSAFDKAIGPGGRYIREVQDSFQCQISHKRDEREGIFVLYAEPRYADEQIADPEVRGKVEKAWAFLKTWKEYAALAVRQNRRVEFIHDYLRRWGGESRRGDIAAAATAGARRHSRSPEPSAPKYRQRDSPGTQLRTELPLRQSLPDISPAASGSQDISSPLQPRALRTPTPPTRPRRSLPAIQRDYEEAYSRR